MKCPNCKQPFVVERSGKFQCAACGWMEKIDKEWKSCEAPESPAPQEPEPEPEPEPIPEPDPAAHEPDPAAHEPDPAANEPTPDNVTKSYLGGLVTVTEVDE